MLNSSPIITLSKISYAHVFERLSAELVIPNAVAKEILAGPSDDAGRSWIEGPGSRFIRPRVEVATVIQAWDLGKRRVRGCAARIGIRLVLRNHTHIIFI